MEFKEVSDRYRELMEWMCIRFIDWVAWVGYGNNFLSVVVGGGFSL